jgi:hypothetical protein
MLIIWRLCTQFCASNQCLIKVDPDISAVAALEACIDKFQSFDSGVNRGIGIIAAVLSVFLFQKSCTKAFVKVAEALKESFRMAGRQS